jgi:hypothetical protein
MLDSPCQGSRTGLTPPISTSMPSTLDPLRPTGFATRRPACRTTTAQQTTRTYTASSDVRAHLDHEERLDLRASPDGRVGLVLRACPKDRRHARKPPARPTTFYRVPTAQSSDSTACTRDARPL